MSPDPHDEEFPTYTWYDPDEEQALSEAVIDAIEAHENIDASREEFVLYEQIDPDALDGLFRPDANADITVKFRIDEVTVTLWGDGGIDIRVTDKE